MCRPIYTAVHFLLGLYCLKARIFRILPSLNLGNERKSKVERERERESEVKKSRKRAATELSCDCCCQVRGWVERLMVLLCPPTDPSNIPFRKTILTRLETKDVGALLIFVWLEQGKHSRHIREVLGSSFSLKVRYLDSIFSYSSSFYHSTLCKLAKI
jgi:hypothetical protein